MVPPLRSCPYCGSRKLRASHRRTFGERFAYLAGLRAPFRCLDCKKRHFGRKHRSLADYLGLGESKTRRELRWLLPLVAALILVGIALWLYRGQDETRKRYRLPSTPPTPPALRH